MMATPHVLVEGVDHRRLRDPAPGTRSSTCAARWCTCTAPAAARGRRGLRGRATSAPTSSARASTSTWSCTPAPAPTSAVRRPRCWTRWRAAAASRGCGRRSPRSPACTPARRWSTTSSRSPACRRSCAAAPTGSRSMGTEKSPGFTLYSLSGHVTRPGQYEAPLGITLRELLDFAGGVRTGHELKFWTPGGSSTPLLTAEHLDVPLDLRAVGAARVDARHQGAADLRRDHLRGAGRAALDRVLHARVLRQVHPVPGGHLLAGPDLRPARARAGHRGRPRHAARHLRQHPRQVVLRARATARPARSRRRSSTSGTSTWRHLTERRLSRSTARPMSTVCQEAFGADDRDREHRQPARLGTAATW